MTVVRSASVEHRRVMCSFVCRMIVAGAGLLCATALSIFQPSPVRADTSSHCALPQRPGDRVGTAQIFAYYLDDRGVLVGRRDIIWGDEGPKLPGIYSMKYMTVDRDLDAKHNVAWYEAQGRSDWVMRKCDGSPATEFDDSNAPVDITRPEIREFLYAQAVTPVVKSKRFDAMAVDNIFSTNTFGRCGNVEGGKLKRRYSGTHVDPTFANDVADWLRWLGARLHADGLCMAGNLWYEEQDIEGFRSLAKLLDIVVDEGGFTRNCKANVVDGHWLPRMKAMRDVAREQPLIVIDYVCPSAADMTPAALDWSLANFLLLRGESTYLAIRPDKSEQGPLYDPPQLHVVTGRPMGDFKQEQGVFYRRFEKAIALVNPSSVLRAEFDLAPDDRWRDLRGVSYAGKVKLAPGSGLVLVAP